MLLFSRRAAQGSRRRALRELYHSFVSENSPEAKGRALLLQWLTPAQRRQFEEQGYFDVVGCATRRPYRVQYGSVANVQEIDFEGQSGGVLCVAPEGYLVPGDVMLAQKIALETDELATLAVANRVAPVGRRRGSGGVGGPDSLSPAAAGINDQNTHGVLRFVPDRDFRNSSVVGALKDDQDQVADRRTGLSVEQARVAGPAGTNRDLKRRVTMLRDQTTRSKLAARQPNGRNPDRLTLHFLPLENLKPVLIAATAVLDLIALRPAWGMVK